MNNPFRWLLSLVFIFQMYLAMLVIAVVFMPAAIWSRNGAWACVHAYCLWVRFSAKVLVGLRSEIHGTVPEGEVLIASKHQSFFDIILICSAVPRPKFIMKKELKWAPLLGWYALRIGCIPVNRGKKGQYTRPVDHLSARHPCCSRRNPALQGGCRPALRADGQALHSGGNQCRRLLASPRHPTQTRSSNHRVHASDCSG